MIQTKLCPSCKNKLHTSCFYKDRNNSDKLSTYCKICTDIKKLDSSNYKKEYYQNNKTHINNLRKKNRLLNTESRNKDILRSKLYYKNNKEKLNQKMQEYYVNNIEEFKNRNKKYREINKDYILQKNRARKNKTKNTISQEQISELIKKFDNSCAYCGILVKKGLNLHFDHVIPLSKNGEHSISNLVPSCKTCNLKKGTKTREEFIKILEKTDVC